MEKETYAFELSCIVPRTCAFEYYFESIVIMDAAFYSEALWRARRLFKERNRKCWRVKPEMIQVTSVIYEKQDQIYQIVILKPKKNV